MSDHEKTRDQLQGEIQALQQKIVELEQELAANSELEVELLSLQEKLNAIFDLAPDAYYIIDLSGNFLDGSRAAESIIGYKREELIGKNSLKLKLLPLEELPRAAKNLAQNVLGKPTGPDEYTLIRKDGQRVPIEIRTMPTTLGGQKVVLGIARDITERKQAEDELSQRTYDLSERIKELHCLYGISTLTEAPGVAFDEIVQGILRLIPPAWQFPEITCARIRVEGLEYQTDNFEETPWKQESEIRASGNQVGKIEVYYVEERAASFEGPFLKKERDLINAIAERIGRTMLQLRAEQALSESEERFRTLVNTSADAIISVNSEGEITLWNQGAENIFGFMAEEVLGKSLSLITPEHLYENHELGISRVLTSGESKLAGTTVELTGKKKDDTEFPVELSLSTWKSGQETFFTGIIRDISERKDAEAALMKSERLYHDLVEASQDLIWRLNTDGQFVFLNNAWETILGYKLDEILGRQFTEFTNPENADKDIKLHKELLAGTTDIGFETVYYSKSGNEVHLVFNAIPLISAEGEVIGTQGTAHNITKHKNMEAVLKQSEEKFRKIYEQSPIAIEIYDRDGRLIDANPVYLDLFGIQSIEQVKGFELFKNPNIPEEIRAKIVNGEPVEFESEFDYDLVQAHGLYSTSKTGHRFLRTHITPIGTDNENPLGFLVQVIDNTTKKLAQEKAVAQERLAAVGQLSAGIAHDFNNILVPITLYSQLLLLEQELSSKGKEQLEIISEQAKRASSLTEQLLDFSRRGVMDLQNLNLVPFLKKFINLLQRTIPETIQIEFSSERENLTFTADPARLEQVFMNLALNARDAMPSGGKLAIDLSQLYVEPGAPSPYRDMGSGSWICVTVTDTGTGIDPDNLSHIYEPFYTTKDPSVGTGLGLAQVYGIVKKLGGYIDVESQLGEGTTFILYFPLLTDREISLARVINDVHLTQRELSILVVEDNQAVREAMSETLQLMNYQVLVATNGREALETIEDHNVDLVMSDIVMPEMGGMELHEAMQERHPEVKMILLTGYPLMEDMREKIEKKAIPWVQKPLDIEKIYRTVQQVLSGSSE